MSLTQTPSSERIQIGFFGRRNAGKSSLVNAVTGQALSLVSPVKGTTTDPVSKAMELLPLGPVVIIDTPGLDDEGALGEMRVKRAMQTINRVDCAVVVVDCVEGIGKAEETLLTLLEKKKIPTLIAYNKTDLAAAPSSLPQEGIAVSAATGEGVWVLKERLGALLQAKEKEERLVGDLLHPGDLVVLVTPIDSAAPKGRLILPQQMTLRDILDADAMAAVVKEDKLSCALAQLKAPPAMVVTDSQVFERVNAETPPDLPLTSFSILMARYKGFLHTAVRGAAAIGRLQEGERVLIAEGCTHHRQCEDIGTVKIPAWLKRYTGKNLVIETASGRDFPEELSRYRLIIHCGGCMLGDKEIRYRRQSAQDAGVPFTNYGVAIAYLHGILRRSLAPFPNILAELDR